MANASAATDTMKTSVDKALSEIYLAFANSDGDQAKQVMKAAMKAACEDGKKPDLPIFGLSEDKTHIGVYGVDVALPENMQAQTPAEMHAIACIVEVQNTIDSKIHIKSVQYPGGNYVWVFKFQNRYYVGIRETRIRLDWNIRLLSISTLDEISETSLAGGMPAPFSKDASAVGSGVLYGKPPQIDLVLQWLSSALK